MENLGFFLGLTTLLTWSFSDIVSKLSLDHEDTLKVLFWGQFFGSLLITGFGFGFDMFGTLSPGLLGTMFLFGLLNVVAMYLFYLSMIKKGAALGVTIVYSWVFVAVLLSMIFYREFPSTFEYFAIASILVGLFFITGKGGKKLHLDRSYAIPLFTMVLWGIFFFALERGAAAGEMWLSLGIKGFSALLLLPFLLKKPLQLFQMKKSVWLGVICMGALDGIGITAYTYASQMGSLSETAGLVASVPALVTLLSVLILKEKINTRQMLGIGFAGLGLILIAI